MRAEHVPHARAFATASAEHSARSAAHPESVEFAADNGERAVAQNSAWKRSVVLRVSTEVLSAPSGGRHHRKPDSEANTCKANLRVSAQHCMMQRMGECKLHGAGAGLAGTFAGAYVISVPMPKRNLPEEATFAQHVEPSSGSK